MTRLEKAILDLGPVKALFNLAKRVKLPGTDGLSLYEIGRFFIKELHSNNLFDSCAAVTYNFVMAIPPTLLVLFSLVPYLPLEGVQATILDTLRIITPNDRIYQSVSTVVTDFMNNERADVLSSGILLTLFFSSNGMMGLIRSFERKHLSVYVPRSGLKMRWEAIKLTVMLLLVALLSIAVLIIQAQALNHIILEIFNNTWIVRIFSVIVVLFINFSAISVIYRYGPSLRQKVKFVSPGSVVATLLSGITSTVFFFLVNNFIHYNKVYGSIGTLMAFMVWLWLNTLVILIGYNLNVSVLLGKQSREEDETKYEEFSH